MCVLALAWHAHPRWRLVLAGNRDEYHARPAVPLARWGGHILSGRDLVSGGTWLGVSDCGRLAVVTNLRGYGAPLPERASRGALVADVLAGEGAYADPDEAQFDDFNPFNLVTIGGGDATFLTNRPAPLRVPLGHGVYGLSNGALDEPWPKTLRLKAAVADWLATDDDVVAPLFATLREEEGTADDRVPDAAIFIADPVYGTRCSTVVAIDAAGRGTIRERRFDAHGAIAGENRLDFAWRD